MKPIIFNTEMVKVILDGRKTQTRRVVNKEYLDMADIDDNNIYVPTEDGGYVNILNTTWSKYKVGDILWVRESAKIIEYTPVGNYGGSWNDCDSARYEYLSDREIGTLLEIPERFNVIPKWIKNCQGIPNGCIKEMARIFLKVTNVRVEKLQDTTKGDVLKEGIKKGLLDMYKHYEISGNGFSDKDYDLNSKYVNGAICSFRTLWNSTAKDGYKWEDNPFVFVYEFERATKES